MCLERHVCRHLVSGPPGRGCAGSRARGLVGVTVLSPSRPKEPAWASGKPGKLSLTKSAPQPQAWTKDSSSLLQNMIFENVLESKCVPFLMSPPRESQHSILSHWFWLVSCSDFFQDGPGTSHQFWLVRFFFFFPPRWSRDQALDFERHRVGCQCCEVQQATQKTEIWACWSKTGVAY